MAGNPIKIVIVGNGFGGVYVLKHLHNLLHGSKTAELYLVGETNYFLFTPLLHEVATGGLNRSNIVEPVRKVLSCCLRKFYLGKAELINTTARTVSVSGEIVPYDYLVIATGAQTNFYNVPGAEQNAFTLKSIADAEKIKHQVIAQIERATHIDDEGLKKKMLRFVVVGGGPTGVELVAELAELVKDTFSRYYTCGVLKYVSLLLVQRQAELVPQFGKKIRAKSLAVLRKKGVEVVLQTAVEAVGSGHIILNGDKRIETETVIWVGGIKPNVPKFDIEPEKTPDGRLVVDEFFALPKHENVFALGDVAAFPDKDSYLPALAQVAEKQARALAENLARRLKNLPPKKFKYKHSGSLLSLGQWMAAGEIKGFAVSGRLCWWIWRTIYLLKFISVRKKILVAIDWTINLFLPRDISEL
ncbi:MAG: NAD(P)/FAD-dependent oxidoreductase [bacterium]|nr:NAD(P)/FAD-dependent oxidoreductase [bacterium]